MTDARIAILGGGISGLSAAYYLAKRGKQVELFESEDQLGGLGTFFSHGGKNHERFYHCMLPSDGPLLGLLADLGIDDKVYWSPSRFGIFGNGKIYPLNTAGDLLTFGVVPFWDRIRIGLTGLYGRVCSSKGLDDVSATQWLSRLSGSDAFKAFWQPLLEAKFGSRFSDVPALWFWSRFNREKAKGPECKGYIRGGYKTIIDALTAELRRLGVSIRLSTSVESVTRVESGELAVNFLGISEIFQQVLFATPHTAVSRVLDSKTFSVAASLLGQSIESQGVVNVVLFLRRSLSDYYWVAAPAEDLPFQGVVQSSNLMTATDSGENHIVYLMNYAQRDEAIFKETDETLIHSHWAGLKKIFPTLRDDDLSASYVFRAPFVEPVYTLGYMNKKPAIVLVPGKVYLSCTAQVYPEVTSWNGSVGLVKQVVDQICEGA